MSIAVYKRVGGDGLQQQQENTGSQAVCSIVDRNGHSEARPCDKPRLMLGAVWHPMLLY